MSSGGSSVYESHMSTPDWGEGTKSVADKEDSMYSPSLQETQETNAIFNALEHNLDTSLPSTEANVNCVPSTEKQGIPLSVPSNMPSLTSIVSKDQSPVIKRTRSTRKVSMKQSPEICLISPSQDVIHSISSSQDVIAKYTNVIQVDCKMANRQKACQHIFIHDFWPLMIPTDHQQNVASTFFLKSPRNKALHL